MGGWRVCKMMSSSLDEHECATQRAAPPPRRGHYSPPRDLAIISLLILNKVLNSFFLFLSSPSSPSSL